MIERGVSDRTATHGQLYDGWGKEGNERLAKTQALQQAAMEKGMNHYDAVLLVSQRADKLEAERRDGEEQENGYIGNSFGGSMGSGMKKRESGPPVVINSIDQLIAEYDESGELPAVMTPGVPEDFDLEAEREAYLSVRKEAALGRYLKGQSKEILADEGQVPQGGENAQDIEEEAKRDEVRANDAAAFYQRQIEDLK